MSKFNIRHQFFVSATNILQSKMNMCVQKVNIQHPLSNEMMFCVNFELMHFEIDAARQTLMSLLRPTSISEIGTIMLISFEYASDLLGLPKMWLNQLTSSHHCKNGYLHVLQIKYPGSMKGPR